MENKTIFFLIAIISMTISILAEPSKIKEKNYQEHIKTMGLFFPPLNPVLAEQNKIKEKDYETLKKIAALSFFCLSCSPELLEAKKPLERKKPLEQRNTEKWYNKITRDDVTNIGIKIGVTVISFIPGILFCGGIEHLKAHYHFFPQPELFIPHQSGTN